MTQADARKALDENFGGEDENPPVAPGFGTTPAFKFTKYSNAYMLVYIRASDWDQARPAAQLPVSPRASPWVCTCSVGCKCRGRRTWPECVFRLASGRF